MLMLLTLSPYHHSEYILNVAFAFQSDLPLLPLLYESIFKIQPENRYLVIHTYSHKLHAYQEIHCI